MEELGKKWEEKQCRVDSGCEWMEEVQLGKRLEGMEVLLEDWQGMPEGELVPAGVGFKREG